jgi:beta-lactamase superfamily II metal-dependent hydrolase
MPEDDTDYIISEGGSPFRVAVREKANADEKTCAESIVAGLKKEFGIEVELVSGAGEDSVPEIVVGLYAWARANDIYDNAAVGGWTVCRRGAKLLVFAGDRASYASAPNQLIRYVARMSEGDTVRLSKMFYGTEPVGNISLRIPLPEGLCATYIQHAGGSDASKRAASVNYAGVNEAAYDAYLARLASSSYVKGFENSIDGNRYAFFTGATRLLSVDYFPSLRLMRIVSEQLPSKPVWELSGGERKYPVRMILIGRSSAFIVTLADGRYLLYDTGYNTAPQMIMDYMTSNNVFTDGKVHIAAVIISHPHDDHMNGLLDLADNYSGSIVCETVMYNIVSSDRQSDVSDTTLSKHQTSINNAAKKLGASVYCLRAGQRFVLSGTEFEVLFTPDELGDYYLSGDSTWTDLNNSSVLVSMTESGQTTLFTGDCRGGEANMVASMFPRGLKADMMEVAHHGYNVADTLRLYTDARPYVLFWPVSKAEVDVSRYFVQELMAASYVKKHIWQEDLLEVTLPYNP